MKHIDIKSKIESLRLKFGVRLNILDIEKYISEENDEEEQKQRLVDLIKKYNLKLNQDIINLFKDKVWFKDIFFMYTSDELLLDERNMQLLNAFFYENKKLPLRVNYSRDLIIKLIKTNIFSNDIYVNESYVEANDYELLKLMKEKNTYFKVKINKEILKKCIELNINPYLISSGYYINKLIYNDDNSIDLELVNSAIKNNIILVDFDTNYELVKRYLEAGIDIKIPSDICEKNLAELYNNYPSKVIQLVRDNYGIRKKFCDYIVDGTINKIDRNILDLVVVYLNPDLILENIEIIKEFNLDENKNFNFFSDYSNEKKEQLKKIIQSGFPNIIKHINKDYIDEEIIDLSVDNGFSDIFFINSYLPNKMKELDILKYLDKMIINYDFSSYYYDSLSYYVEIVKNNKDILYKIITNSQKDIYSRWLDNDYISANLDYFLNRLREDNNKIYYSNFIANVCNSRLDNEIMNRVIEECRRVFDNGNLDLNLFDFNTFNNRLSSSIFKSDNDIKIAFDLGYKDIFVFIKQTDLKKWIEYALSIGYTTDSDTCYNVTNFIKNNMNYFQDIVKINSKYINILSDRYDIERNIDLIYECINNGVQINDSIKKYLLINEPEKKYVYKLSPKIKYLFDNENNERNSILKYINGQNYYSRSNCSYFSPEEDSIIINTFNDNINNQDYKEYIIAYIKKNNNIPRNMIDKIISNDEIISELIDYSIDYIRYVNDEYIENNKEQLIEKIIKSNNIAKYIDYNFVREYLKNIDDIDEIIRIKKSNNISNEYFNDEIVKNNSFLNIDIYTEDYLIHNFNKVIENPNLIIGNEILFRKVLENTAPYDFYKLFNNIVVLSDNISNIIIDYPDYLKYIEISKFSNNFIELNYKKIINNGIEINIESRAYLFNNCDSYREYIKSENKLDSEIEQIGSYIIYEKIKSDLDILIVLIEKNNINTIIGLKNDLDVVKKLLDTGEIYIINYLEPDILLDNPDLYKLAISKGFRCDKRISMKLVNNIEFIKMYINNNLDIINYISDDILNDEENGIVDFVFKNGYKISNNTPKAILYNLSYIKKYIIQNEDLDIYDKINYIDKELLFDESNGLFDLIFDYKEIPWSYIKNICDNNKYVKIILDKVLTLDERYANLVDVLKYVDIDIIDDKLFELIASKKNLLNSFCNNNSIYKSKYINDIRVIDEIIHNYYLFENIIDYLNEESIKYIVDKYANILLWKCNNIIKLIDIINDNELKSRVILMDKIKRDDNNLTDEQKKLLLDDKVLYTLLITNGRWIPSRFSSIQYTDDTYKEKIFQLNVFSKINRGITDFSKEEIDIVLNNKEARDKLIFWTIFGYKHFKERASEEIWNYIKLKIPCVIQFYYENNVDGFSQDNFKEVYEFAPFRYCYYLYKNKITDRKYYEVLNDNINDIIDEILNKNAHVECYTYLIDYLDETSLNLLKSAIENNGYSLIKCLTDNRYELTVNSPIELKNKNTILYAAKNNNLDFSNGLLVYGLTDEECKAIYDENIFDSNIFSILYNDEYKKYYDDAVIHYIEFRKKDIYYHLNISITSFADIYKYFDTSGPKKEIYEKALLNNKALQLLFENPEYLNDYINRIKPSKEIIQYIEFVKENGNILEKYINSLTEINDYFDKDGFRYNLIIDNMDLAYIIVTKTKDWEKHINDSADLSNLKLISEYRDLFVRIPNNEIKKKIFNIDFFNRLYQCPFISGIDYNEFLLRNICNIDTIIENIELNNLIMLELPKDLFINLISQMVSNKDMIDVESWYVMHCSLSADLRKTIFNSIVLNRKSDFDLFKIIKYNLKNNLLSDFFEIYQDDKKIELMKSLYNYLKIESGDSLGGGTRFIIKLASSINNNYELFSKINERLKDDKSPEFLYEVLCKIYGKDVSKNSVNNQEINYENLSVVDLKNEILLDLLGIGYEEYQVFLERNMDVDTLLKIKNKINTKLKMIYESNPIDYEYANYLEENLQQICIFEIVLDAMLSSINSTNNKEQLLKLLIDIKQDSQKYIPIRKFSLNLYDRVRQIYELDAQLSLTRISEVQKEINQNEELRKKILKKVDINGVEIEYYDLSTYEYVLYAHADSNVNNLFNSAFDKNSVLCLSPVSDRGLKGYYSGGIIYGYDYVLNGAFIASSSRNTGSNGHFNNNIEISLDFLNNYYDQKEIKESSALQLYSARSHSETNIARDGMFPSCVIIRGETPTQQEIAAAIELGKYLGLPDGTPAPLIKLQSVNARMREDELDYFDFSIYAHMDERTISDVMHTAVVSSTDTELGRVSMSIEHYKELYDQIEKIEQFRRYKLRTGASHDIYKCKINGDDYYVKPALDGSISAPHRAYAVLLGSKMQQLINPNNAVNAYVETYQIDGVDVLCSFLEDKKDTLDFDIVDNSSGNNFPNLNEQQIESFLRELIVDHLLFNYDTKGVNFLYDRNHVYGIDKEQSLKFCDQVNGVASKGIDSSRQTGNGVAMYQVFLQHYKDKISEDKIVEIYTDILKKVESISLVDFFMLYMPYLEVNGYTNKKVQSIIGRRLRLVDEVIDFVKNTFGCIINYDEKDLTSEIEELNLLLQQKGLEKVVKENGRTK